MTADFKLSDDARYWLRDVNQNLEIISAALSVPPVLLAVPHLCDHRCAPLDADEGVRRGGRYCECPCHPWNLCRS